MTILPPETTYGHVKGRFLLADPDGSDGGRLPDARLATGTVVITPASNRTVATDGTMVFKPPIPCTIVAGQLRDAQGADGVWLIAGFYNATITIPDVAPLTAGFEVTAAHTEAAPLLITLYVDLLPDPGVRFVVNEQVYLDTIAARDQVVALLADVELGVGSKGDPGDSAYERAIANGFVGTEVEWLASLEGVDGADGAQGLSAYQVALASGFVGSQAAWLLSLKGADGADGVDGAPGAEGGGGAGGGAAGVYYVGSAWQPRPAVTTPVMYVSTNSAAAAQPADMEPFDFWVRHPDALEP